MDFMQPGKQYKYLTFLTLFYMTAKLTTVVLIYKVITIGPFSVPASTLVMLLWFILGDLIAEVYGSKVARHVMEKFALWKAFLGEKFGSLGPRQVGFYCSYLRHGIFSRE